MGDKGSTADPKIKVEVKIRKKDFMTKQFLSNWIALIIIHTKGSVYPVILAIKLYMNEGLSRITCPQVVPGIAAPLKGMRLRCKTAHNPWTDMVLFLEASSHVFQSWTIPLTLVAP